MPKFAITGNIASGKSVVERYLEEKGFIVYDTDAMTHQILETSLKIKEIFNEYDVFDENKNICRKKLGKLVFNHPTLLKKLEQIIHPIVKEKIKCIQDDISFVSVPLLFETNMQDLFDKIIFVSADKKIRLERLMLRNSLSKTEALQRINAQTPEEEKIKNSDFIVYNNGDISDIYKQIDEILYKL